MTTATTKIDVRMYNVGFGDAFRVTVRRGNETWRMLVDCGVHSQGTARPIDESVKQIIEDLRDDCGDEPPHFDVVVATHHHQDHISGFAEDAWTAVHVGEVWVPFVEDSTDADAKSLRTAHDKTAKKLAAMIDTRHKAALDASDGRAAQMMATAMELALNSSGNQKATDRLLSRDGTTFANKPPVRYLPSKSSADNTIQIEKCDVQAHILGPPRDAAMLKKMNPPSKVGWLTLNLDDESVEQGPPYPLFNAKYVVANPQEVPADLGKAAQDLRLAELAGDAGLLAAASVLEQAVNNTSLFFVLEVAGLRFLFPGDAQWGAWQSVRENPKALELIQDVDFYKVGHHGSHNATPKEFILNEWKKPGDAMVPWGLVERWKNTIPKKELIKALTEENHRVILPEKVIEGGRASSELREGDWWQQLTFTVRGRR